MQRQKKCNFKTTTFSHPQNRIILFIFLMIQRLGHLFLKQTVITAYQICTRRSSIFGDRFKLVSNSQRSTHHHSLAPEKPDRIHSVHLMLTWVTTDRPIVTVSSSPFVIPLASHSLRGLFLASRPIPSTK